MTVKSYFIEYSTENEAMFDELGVMCYSYDTEDWGDRFLITIWVPDDEIVILEDIMKWYV